MGTWLPWLSMPNDRLLLSSSHVSHCKTIEFGSRPTGGQVVAGSNLVSPTREISLELRKCWWLKKPHRPRPQAVSNTQTAAADISTAVP
jgi:hypothetical protein